MSNHDFDQYFDVSLKLVKEAGIVVSNAFRKEKNVEEKSSPNDLVTETDKAVEKLLIDALRKEFPTHKFIGEESTAEGVFNEFTNEPTWIIDPVDGTMNFVHSFPYTCISVGLWVNKKPEIAVVFNPILDQMFTARSGKGSYLNGKKISVSVQKELKKSLVMVEMGTRPDPVKMDIVFRNIQVIAAKVHGIRCMGSAALNMCHVAMGAVEAYYEIGIHAWDMAAGYLIIQEAGGVIMDVNGGPFDLLGRRLVCASNKKIADEIVNMIEIYEEERD